MDQQIEWTNRAREPNERTKKRHKLFCYGDMQNLHGIECRSVLVYAVHTNSR